MEHKDHENIDKGGMKKNMVEMKEISNEEMSKRCNNKENSHGVK